MQSALFYNDRVSQRNKHYRLIDHTGDLGLEVWGEDLPQLFVRAAWAFSDVLVAAETIVPIVVRTLTAEAPDREALLVAWLGELLYVFETEQIVFGRFEIETLTDQTLRARAWGEPFDLERHRFKQAVKAVTYHRLQVKETAKGWRARVIVDV